ncbi:MAG: hypothetical protein J7L39_00090 [Candidatus Aenigmarchaeota archaeon]|nr:hypothetical protein [Candidatus Aenigmarchaeota archaeon]
MKFFDLRIKVEKIDRNDLSLFCRNLTLLGYQGAAIIFPEKLRKKCERLEERLNEISKKENFLLLIGFEAKNIKELRRLINDRKKFDLLVVKGGDLNLNRKACESPEVDVLFNPEANRKDSGMNHISVKMAAKNGVALGISFKKFIEFEEDKFLIKKLLMNVRLAKKYGMKIVIASGASNPWEVVDPCVLISVGKILEMEINEAKKSVSRIPYDIIKTNKERRKAEWIAPGIKVVKNEKA